MKKIILADTINYDKVLNFYFYLFRLKHINSQNDFTKSLIYHLTFDLNNFLIVGHRLINRSKEFVKIRNKYTVLDCTVPSK